MKVQTFFLVLLLTLCGYAFANAAEVNDRISATVDNQGQLIIKNSYLSNYIFRGVNPETNEVGPFVLLKRNRQKLDFKTAAGFEWNGIYPTFEPDWPDFATETTTIDLAGYNYPGGIDWKNSGLEFRGGSLAGYVTQRPEGDEAVERVFLTALNALTAFEIVTQIYGGYDTRGFILSPNTINNINSFAETVRDYQSTLEQVGDYVELIEIILEQTELLLDAVEVDSDALTEVRGSIDYFQSFTQAFDELNIVAMPSTDTGNDRAARKGLIAEQYKKLLETDADSTKTADAIFEDFIGKFTADYNNSSTDEARFETVIKYGLEPINDVLTLYKSIEEDKLKRLKLNSGSPQAIEQQQNKVNTVRSAFAVAALAKFLAVTDDFAAEFQENPDKLIATIADVGKAVADQLVTLDNIEIVTKRAWQSATDWDGRTRSFTVIRKSFGALRIGNEVGNKAIPFLWDAILGETKLKSDILEGVVNPFGSPETIIEVLRNNEVVSTFSNRSGELNHLIAAEQGDRLTFKASFYQPKLFEPNRAPWELNYLFNPQTLHKVGIVAPSLFRETKLCVRKRLGNLDYAVHKRGAPRFESETAECGVGTLLGGTAFENIGNIQTVYNDPSSLPNIYKVNNAPDNIFGYLADLAYNVVDQNNDVVTVSYNGLSLSGIVHKFQIVPATGEVTFEVDSSDLTLNNLMISAVLPDTIDNTSDPITQVTWNWGDGTSISTPGPSSPSHTYDARGFYTITVMVTRRSGQVSSYMSQVDILAPMPMPMVSAPSGLSALSRDKSVTLSWDNVPNAVGYTIYYAKESFGQTPDLSNYESLLGGSRLETANESSLTLSGLENGVTYFFIVTAKDANGEGPASEEISETPGLGPDDNVVIFETYDGVVSQGNAVGIDFALSPNGQAALFTRDNESRIEYPYSQGFPRQGTIELSVNVENAYNYRDFALNDDQDCALIFTTDIQGGDVTRAGSTWLYGCKNGDISLYIADGPGRPSQSPQFRQEVIGTDFRFDQWHNIGFSYGNEGRYISLDGDLIASDTQLTQNLGGGGIGTGPDEERGQPTIGESVSSVWANNRYEGGFEGLVDTFRVSSQQKDWRLTFSADDSMEANKEYLNSSSTLKGGKIYSTEFGDFGIQIVEVDSLSLERRIVFSDTQEVRGVWMDSDAEGIFAAYLDLSAKLHVISPNFDNIWTEAFQVDLPACDAAAQTNACSFQQAFLKDGNIVGVIFGNRFDNRFNRVDGQSLVGEASFITLKSRPSEYLFEDNTLYYFSQVNRAGSPGTLSITTIKDDIKEETSIVEGGSASGFAGSVVQSYYQGQLDYIWTARGFTESTRRVGRGKGLDAEAGTLACTGLPDDLKTINSMGFVTEQYGSFYLHRYTSDSSNFIVRIYDWEPSQACPLSTQHEFTIPINFLAKSKFEDEQAYYFTGLNSGRPQLFKVSKSTGTIQTVRY